MKLKDIKYLGVIPVIISLVCYLITRNSVLFIISMIVVFVYFLFISVVNFCLSTCKKKKNGKVEKSKIMDLWYEKNFINNYSYNCFSFIY